MQLKDIIQKTTQFFRDKGFSSPRLDTELLLAKALQWDRVRLYLNYDYPLTEIELSTARDLVRRRATGEPVAYILGQKDFYNHAFAVRPGVLIPRPETETIVSDVIAWSHGPGLGPGSEVQVEAEAGNEPFRVIDFGTGSGCIGLSILAGVTRARLLGVDVSPVAIEVATENAERLDCSDRASFLRKDVMDLDAAMVAAELGGFADVVVANPPYIASDDPNVEPDVRKHEPSIALFSEDEGLGHVRAWSLRASEIVRSGGLVMFEIGHGQGRRATAIFEAIHAFGSVEVVKDLSGKERFIRCVRA